MTSIVVQQSEIGPSSFTLTSGGQTDRISIVEVSDGSRYVFKEYAASANPDRTQLIKICEWPSRLSNEEQTWLHTNVAWPRHLVENSNGAVIGVLLPIAPAHYWTNADGQPSPREGTKLLGRKTSGEKEYFPDPDLYVVLAKLLRMLLWFHKRDVVIGDIHLANILIGDDAGAISPFLIDMDGVWIQGRSAFELTQNPRYAPPYEELSELTTETDLFKFGLIACKVLGRHHGALATVMEVHGKIEPSPRFSPSQKTIVDSMLAYGSDQHVSEQSLESLASQWEACKVGNEQYVYSSDSEAQQAYDHSYSLITFPAELSEPIRLGDAQPSFDARMRESSPPPSDQSMGNGTGSSTSSTQQPVFTQQPGTPTSKRRPPWWPKVAFGVVALGILSVIIAQVMNQDEAIGETPVPTPTPATATLPLPTSASMTFVDAFVWDDGIYYDIGGDSEPAWEGFSEGVNSRDADDSSFACNVGDAQDVTYRTTLSGESPRIYIPAEPGQYTYVRFCVEDEPERTDWTLTITESNPQYEQCLNPPDWTHNESNGRGARILGLEVDRRCVVGDKLGLEITPRSEDEVSIPILGVSVWQGDYKFANQPSLATEEELPSSGTDQAENPESANQPDQTVSETERADSSLNTNPHTPEPAVDQISPTETPPSVEMDREAESQDESQPEEEAVPADSRSATEQKEGMQPEEVIVPTDVGGVADSQQETASEQETLAAEAETTPQTAAERRSSEVGTEGTDNTATLSEEGQSSLEAPADLTSAVTPAGSMQAATPAPANGQLADEVSMVVIPTTERATYYDIGGDDEPDLAGFGTDIISNGNICQVEEFQDSTGRAFALDSEAPHTRILLPAEALQHTTISLCMYRQDGDEWALWLGLPRLDTPDCAGRSYANADQLNNGINLVEFEIAPECVTGSAINLAFVNISGGGTTIYGVLVDQDPTIVPEAPVSAPVSQSSVNAHAGSSQNAEVAPAPAAPVPDYSECLIITPSGRCGYRYSTWPDGEPYDDYLDECWTAWGYDEWLGGDVLLRYCAAVNP